MSWGGKKIPRRVPVPRVRSAARCAWPPPPPRGRPEPSRGPQAPGGLPKKFLPQPLQPATGSGQPGAPPRTPPCPPVSPARCGGERTGSPGGAQSVPPSPPLPDAVGESGGCRSRGMDGQGDKGTEGRTGPRGGGRCPRRVPPPSPRRAAKSRPPALPVAAQSGRGSAWGLGRGLSGEGGLLGVGYCEGVIGEGYGMGGGAR